MMGYDRNDDDLYFVFFSVFCVCVCVLGVGGGAKKV